MKVQTNKTRLYTLVIVLIVIFTSISFAASANSNQTGNPVGNIINGNFFQNKMTGYITHAKTIYVKSAATGLTIPLLPISVMEIIFMGLML